MISVHNLKIVQEGVFSDIRQNVGRFMDNAKDRFRKTFGIKPTPQGSVITKDKGDYSQYIGGEFSKTKTNVSKPYEFSGVTQHIQKMKDEEFKKNFAKLGNAGPGTGGGAALKAGQNYLKKTNPIQNTKPTIPTLNKPQNNLNTKPTVPTNHNEETQPAKASFLSKLAKTTKDHAPELGAGAAALGLGAGALALMRKRRQTPSNYFFR